MGGKTVKSRSELRDHTLPNFLIVGAAKCGTTSLHNYLAQHPDVFMPAAKEPHYFVNGYGWDLEGYLGLFRGAGSKAARGEASTGYLYSPESPAWIRTVLGPVKIIILLRDPAERAWSLYKWMVMEGYENAPTFEAALRLESARMHDDGWRESCPEFVPDYLYFDSGLYYRQVERYYGAFGRDNVKVFRFEELASAPEEVCRQVFRFLGVTDSFRPKYEVHNVGRLPRSAALQYWLRNRARRFRLRPRLVNGLWRANLWLGSRGTKPRAAIAELTERYREDLSALEALLGWDLSAWRAEVRRAGERRAGV
jgi:hypothetical protein